MFRKFVTILLLLLAGGAALYLLGRWSFEQQRHKEIHGKLWVNRSLIPVQTFDSGSFTLSWEPTGSLAVRQDTSPDSILWSTIPGRSFVSAAAGQEIVDESLSHFYVSDHQHTICADQIIDSVAGSGKEYHIEGSLICRDGRAPVPYTLIFSESATDQLSFHLHVEDDSLNRLFLTYASEVDERFFGFGTQFSAIDMKGKRLPIMVTEQGVGRGAQPITAGAELTRGAGGAWHTTYAPVPFHISSKLRSLVFENSEYMLFDLRQPGSVQIKIFAPQLRGRILAGNSPPDLLETFTTYAGRMRRLPNWILEGAVIGIQGGTGRVREVWAQLQEHDTPIAAFWLQDWSGQRVTEFGKQLWWNWELDEDRYPAWETLVSDLAQDDIRTMIYINPMMTDAAEKANHKRNLLQEADDQGFLVRDMAGDSYTIETVGFPVGLLDLTNPAAVEWYQDVILEEMIRIGAAGWMADYGEALPFDAQLFSGEPAPSYHNRYPEAWAELNREAINKAGMSEEAVFFMRSGFTRSTRFSTLFWLGDQLVSWDEHDGIKTAVTGLLSSGLSGYSLNHGEIGGFTTINNPLRNYHRNRELLWRWMELAAFNTIFRTHEGVLPEANHQIYSDEETMAFFSRLAKIYKAWSFYRKQLVQEAAASGLPLARHPFIHYPDDPQVYDLTYQEFLIGRELLVAPVLEPGVDEVVVYFPAGEWIHLWTGQVYGTLGQGSRQTVNAPLGQPAVFYRAGSAVGRQFSDNLRQAGLLLNEYTP